MKMRLMVEDLLLAGCGKTSNDTVRAAVYPILDAFPFYLAQGLPISIEFVGEAK